MAMSETVVFLGKLGHGKTRLLNAICDTGFKSSMAARSCTTTIQRGRSKSYGIQVIDTPGFFSSSDTAGHTQCQKNALQCCPLSGVYLVVKIGRVDDMVGTLSTMMDFIGDDDVRIIITFVDAEWTSKEEDPIPDLVGLLDVSADNILAVGLKTRPRQIEEFIKATLHSPRYFQTDDDHEALVNTLHVGARKLFFTVDSIAAAQASAHPEDEKYLWILGAKLIEGAKELSPEDNLELVRKLEASTKLATSLEGENNRSCAATVLTSVLCRVKYPFQGLKRKAPPDTMLGQRPGGGSVYSTRGREEWNATSVVSHMLHKATTSHCDIPLGNTEAASAAATSINKKPEDRACSVSSTSVDVELEVAFQRLEVDDNRHQAQSPNTILGLLVCFCWSGNAKKRRLRYADEECC